VNSVAELLEKADQRLYAAKRHGRGRTVVSDDVNATGEWLTMHDTQTAVEAAMSHL
jgi:predicted signal transduction protein with EAL and GGDEF domain